MSVSNRVRASKWGPFTTLCGYVGRGQQGEIERTVHPPPTNSKNRLKSFCEVGYANFSPNVIVAGKRISMEILVVVGLHAWSPVAFKICSFFKKRKSERKILIVFVTLSDLNKTSNRDVAHTYKMHENWSVLYCKSDMHVRPMRFSILCTSTYSSDKTQMMYSTILLCLFTSKYDIKWKQAGLQYRVQQHI